jgi:hypothetical protein
MFGDLLLLGMFWSSKETKNRNLPVVFLPVYPTPVSCSTLPTAKLREKIEEALKMLALFSPAYYKTARDRMRGIVIVSLRPDCSDARWCGYSKLCLMDIDYVSGSSPVDIALTIVHESTHARLEARGIGYSPETRARVEKICTKTMLLALSHFPASPEKTASLKKCEEIMTTPPSFWSDENLMWQKMESRRRGGSNEKRWGIEMINATKKYTDCRRKRVGLLPNIEIHLEPEMGVVCLSGTRVWTGIKCRCKIKNKTNKAVKILCRGWLFRNVYGEWEYCPGTIPSLSPPPPQEGHWIDPKMTFSEEETCPPIEKISSGSLYFCLAVSQSGDLHYQETLFDPSFTPERWEQLSFDSTLESENQDGQNINPSQSIIMRKIHPAFDLWLKKQNSTMPATQ